VCTHPVQKEKGDLFGAQLCNARTRGIGTGFESKRIPPKLVIGGGVVVSFLINIKAYSYGRTTSVWCARRRTPVMYAPLVPVPRVLLAWIPVEELPYEEGNRAWFSAHDK
jgi:hypothetical protein